MTSGPEDVMLPFRATLLPMVRPSMVTAPDADDVVSPPQVAAGAGPFLAATGISGPTSVSGTTGSSGGTSSSGGAGKAAGCASGGVSAATSAGASWAVTAPLYHAGLSSSPATNANAVTPHSNDCRRGMPDLPMPGST